jgi:hypothetical protein
MPCITIDRVTNVDMKRTITLTMMVLILLPQLPILCVQNCCQGKC